MASEPVIVQAVFTFSGSNNDELCFKKGDLITVTQKDEGWWEGTFGGTTGWFPSNYVREIKENQANAKTTEHERREYQAIVLREMFDSEQAHVTELQGLVTNFLHPLEKSTILNEDEYKQLIGNIMEILDVHLELLKLIELEQSKFYRDQKVGRLFMNWAPKIKNVHQTYCSQHPRAVCILDKYKDELTKYMESLGAANPGILVLTTGLSKPFRRLDKYSGMLLELERHVEESHADRGDTQRSVAVYKEIAAKCAAIRRQKELELQVLTGPVRGWEGQILSTLGDIIYMGSVAVGPQHLDRYLVLFPSTLLILSVSHRLSAFIYEGKLPLTGITVVRLEDSDQYKNAFEITGPMIEKVTAICQSRDETNHWVDILRKNNPNTSNRPSMSNISQKILPSQAEIIPQPPPHMTAVIRSPNTTTSSSTVNLHHTTTNNNNNTNSNHLSTASLLSYRRAEPSRGWSLHCLRTAPPQQPCVALSNGGGGGGGGGRQLNQKSSHYRDDALILEVIEAYCVQAKPRNTLNSVDIQPLDGNRNYEYGKQSAEKIDALQYKIRKIESLLNHEKTARCSLQQILKNYLKQNSVDTDSIDWPITETFS